MKYQNTEKPRFKSAQRSRKREHSKAKEKITEREIANEKIAHAALFELPISEHNNTHDNVANDGPNGDRVEEKPDEESNNNGRDVIGRRGSGSGGGSNNRASVRRGAGATATARCHEVGVDTGARTRR